MSATIVNRFFNEVMTAHKPELLEDLLHPEFQSHTFPAPPGSKKTEFIEGAKGLLNAFPDFKVTIIEQAEKDDKVFTFAYWTGTQKGTFMDIAPTNKQVKVDAMDIWRVEDGKIIENWVVMDIMGLMVQLGAVPEPAVK